MSEPKPIARIVSGDAAASPEVPLREVRRFEQLIGQVECIRRLTAFRDLHVTRGEAPEHILLTGAEGMGKRAIARAFAKSYNVPIKEKDAREFEARADLTMVLTALEASEVLLVTDFQAMRRNIAELLVPCLERFQIDVTLGRGPAARVHTCHLNRFTLFATASKPSDVPPERLRSFGLSLTLEPYSSSELDSIALTLGNENGLILGQGVAPLLVSVCEGSPAAIEQMMRRLARFGKAKVTKEEAIEILSAFGLNPRTVGTAGRAPSAEHLEQLTGVEFETLITALLHRMGFHAEMTKASGDGGIDIVAQFQKPLVGGRYLIQCKRFTPDALVGAPVVREFYGALVADRRAIKGIFITTSGFTAQAREFAQSLPLELIDGSQLKTLLAEHMPAE
jgi:Holliday junction resolvasome RuvABC ATP-dependent DNA helicase subunit